MRILSSAVILLAITHTGFTQSSSAITSPVTAGSAENSWQLSPVNLAQQKDIAPPNLRTQRTDYFATLLAPILKVQQDDLTGSASFPGSYTSVPLEIPNQPGSIWLIAHFDSYAVFPVGARGAYTEMYLTVQQVIVDPSAIRISPGSQVATAVGGGAFTGNDGKTHRFLVAPKRYSMKPGGVYLLDLQHSQLEGLFSLSKQWSIINNVLVPNTPEDVFLASSGKSSLAGLSTSSAASAIKKKLAASQ